MTSILSVSGVQKSFSGIEVLKNLDVEVPRGKVTALIGSNGAGKSTLLNIVSGLIRPDQGMITLDGADITSLMPHQRARQGLARTFQHPRSFRSLTVLESVMLGATPPEREGLVGNLLRVFAPRDHAEKAAAERSRKVLELCRLSDKANTPAESLSYGEQKLLMLAQVLAHDGKLLCFDELCAGLEEQLIEHVRALFRKLADDGASVLFIEHNLKLVRELADWVVFLHVGTVYRSGETEAVLTDPDVVQLYLGQ